MNKVAKGGIALVFASASLFALLGKWEGDNQYRVYADTLAGGLPTVCRGLTRHVTKTPIVVGETWAESKCNAEERKAIIAVQGQLIKCFKRSPSQNVFDAASSHAWNNGAPATCGSQAMYAWNAGEWELGCRRLYQSDSGRPAWSFVKTGKFISGRPEYKFVQGLANRRKDEYKLCVGGVN
jgi:lysozyme